MINIFTSYLDTINKNINELYFLYSWDRINDYNITFNQLIKSYDKNDNEIIILVQNIEKCDSLKSIEIHLEINNSTTENNNNDNIKIQNKSEKNKDILKDKDLNCCIFFVVLYMFCSCSKIENYKKKFSLKTYRTWFYQFFTIGTVILFDYFFDWIRYIMKLNTQKILHSI